MANYAMYRTCTIDEPMIGKSIDQSMTINRLISIIDEQSMLRFFVIINFIDYQFLSIIDANRSVSKRVSVVDF